MAALSAAATSPVALRVVAVAVPESVIAPAGVIVTTSVVVPGVCILTFPLVPDDTFSPPFKIKSPPLPDVAFPPKISKLFPAPDTA